MNENLLLYSKTARKENDPLRVVIEGELPRGQIEMYTHFEAFFQRIHQPTFHLMAAVLVAQDARELSNLVSVRHLLSDIRIILVLPDHAPDTVSSGFRLWPRFMCSLKDDFRDIAGVLRKLRKRRSESDARFPLAAPKETATVGISGATVAKAEGVLDG